MPEKSKKQKKKEQQEEAERKRSAEAEAFFEQERAEAKLLAESDLSEEEQEGVVPMKESVDEIRLLMKDMAKFGNFDDTSEEADRFSPSPRNAATEAVSSSPVSGLVHFDNRKKSESLMSYQQALLKSNTEKPAAYSVGEEERQFLESRNLDYEGLLAKRTQFSYNDNNFSSVGAPSGNSGLKRLAATKEKKNKATAKRQNLDNAKSPFRSAPIASKKTKSNITGRFGNLDAIASNASSTTAASKKNKKKALENADYDFDAAVAEELSKNIGCIHPLAVEEALSCIQSGRELRDLHLACQDGDEIKLFEIRAKPVVGQEHIIAFSTDASQEGSSPTSLAVYDTRTGDIHENHTEWAKSMAEQNVNYDHCHSIAEMACDFIDAVTKEL